MTVAAFPAGPRAAVVALARPARARLVLLFFFGLLALFLAQSDRLLGDPDTYWHIAVGERIWDNATLPRTDELSHTFAGAPWIAKEWLSQVILYGAHALAGWWGVAVLTAVSGAAFLALTFAWLLRRLPPLAVFVIAGFVVILAAGHIVARPHIFSFPLLMLWLAGLTGAVERNASPPWWLVPLMALWANLHASFPIAFVLAGFLALEAIDRAAAGARVRTAVDWGVLGVAALLAAGLTPYGYEPALISFHLFGSGEAFRYILEWQPLEADLTGIAAMAALLATVILLLTSPRQNLFRLAIILLCGYLMIRHVRFTSPFGIVAAIVVAAPLARRMAMPNPAAMRFRPAAADLVLTIGVAVLAGISVLLAALVRPAPSPAMSPAAALAAAREIGVTGPVYNDYNFGGYLISRGVPTFIDGRADQIFLGGFMTEIYDSAESSDESRFPALLDRYGVTWALVRPGEADARRLEAAPGWAQAYADDVAAIYRKRIPNQPGAEE
jgi:hypothetical protein